MVKNLILIVLITAIYSCRLEESNSIENEADISSVTKSENKPIASEETKRFEIYSSINNGAENITEYQYLLLDNKLSDSVIFLKSKRHDLPAPHYFWTSNQKILIYEQDVYYGQQSVIKFLDPEKKQSIYETSGFFQGHPTQKSDYLDKENNILFCFVLIEKNQKIAIKKIDLTNYSDSIIFEFSCFDRYEKPTLKINQTDRLLSFNYSCQESNKADLTNENGKIKY